MVKGSRQNPDPTVLPIIEKSRKLANIVPGGKAMTLIAYVMEFEGNYGSHLIVVSNVVSVNCWIPPTQHPRCLKGQC
ncbi:hypothetical protein C5167_030576 [Papaver somniferum]|nr:hypothetical protein C5167_030576 [Papaver somniferum]